MTNKTGFSRVILAWLLMLTVSVLGFGQQTSRAPAIMVDTPTITLTTATADTTATPSTGAHTAIVQFKFGTVTGTYTTCTVQAKTTLDGTNYLNLSTAASITVTTGTTNTWTVTAKGPTSGNTSTPSTTTADGFGQLTKYTVACSGAYGTSAPVTVSVIYSPDVIASAATAAGTVAISQTGTENQVQCTNCGGGTTDTDDGTVAAGQTFGLIGGLTQVFDGTNWKRFTIGPAGTASTQVITVQGIASMTPILATVTGSLTNISGTISLPTGAATAVKQPALGTAGSASTDVISVQGIASMTPLLATLSGTNNLNNISGTVSLPTGASTAAKQPALGTAGTAASDVISIQGIASMTPVLTTLSGTNNINTVTTVTTVSSATLAAETTKVIGTVRNKYADGTDMLSTDQVPVYFAPQTSGGCTPGTPVEAGASDNHTNLKNGAGQVCSFQITNTHTAGQNFRLYNAATGFNGCNSATNLIWEGMIPGAATSDGITVIFPSGLPFSTGISWCYSGAFGNTDTTSATASKSTINIQYK